MSSISLLTKNVTKLLQPPRADCSPFPRTFIGNPADGKKSYPNAKQLLISPIRKILLNRFKSFAVKSFISSSSNSNFQVIILCNLHLRLQSVLLYHILNFRLYVRTYYANGLINVYWMLPLTWQKHWMIEALLSKIAIPFTFLFPPSLQCYFENPASFIARFSLFYTPFFVSNFIKFQLTPLQLGICGFAG